MGKALRELVRQKKSRVADGRLMPDHVHMLISISPKYAVASVVDFVKGKRAIHRARSVLGDEGTSRGRTFGREAPSFQRSVWMKLLFVDASESRSKRIAGWINSN
jgi:putative transposase